MTKRVFGTILLWFALPLVALTLLNYAPVVIRFPRYVSVYVPSYWNLGRSSFDKARSVVEAEMSKAPNGPWEYVRSRFVMTYEFKGNGPKPTWVIRYRNTKSGLESKRIFVPIPEFSVYTTAIVLDALSEYGFLPP